MANRWGDNENSNRLYFGGAPKSLQIVELKDYDIRLKDHEIKRLLLLGRKAMNNFDSILKSRDITLPTKLHLVKFMIIIAVMYGCESWTIKKTEYQRIDAFELCCWR